MIQALKIEMPTKMLNENKYHVAAPVIAATAAVTANTASSATSSQLSLPLNAMQ